jgi:UDP-glucose 4-epimerase
MGSAPAQLESETEALNTLLREVAQDDHLRAAPGSIAFASSAGALYAGCTDDTVTEVSEVVPTTHYSIEKLKQEALLRNFHLAGTTRVLIARISTLFGPKARGRANKGLIANLARSMLNHEPVRIFVPLDTMRDYIYADDAANAMINTLRSMPATSPFRIKILASQRVTTVAEIIALIGRVAHRHPRIITGATALTSKYAARITFRSCEGEDTAELYRTALHVGIARVLESERLSFVSPNPRS